MAACFEQTLDVPDLGVPNDPSSLRARLMAGLPQEMAKTFTQAQFTAIERALEEVPTSKPRVDVHLSIPLFRRRCFFVFLAGSERRSPERRRQDRSIHRLWRFANIAALSFALLFLIPAFLGLSHIVVALAAN